MSDPSDEEFVGQNVDDDEQSDDTFDKINQTTFPEKEATKTKRAHNRRVSFHESDDNSSVESHENEIFTDDQYATLSNAENYIEYIFNVYSPVSLENYEYLGLIKICLLESSVQRQLNEIIRNCGSKSQTYEVLRNMVDDILLRLVKKSKELHSPDELQKSFIEELVANSVFKLLVKLHTRNVIKTAQKQVEVSRQRIYSVDLQSPGLRNSWSLETLFAESSDAHNRDSIFTFTDNLSGSDVDSRRVSVLMKGLRSPMGIGEEDNQQTARTPFCSHIKPTRYVPIPSVYRLPMHPKAPFPKSYQAMGSYCGRRLTRVNYTAVVAPSFALHEPLNHIHSKLTKYYNTTIE